MAASPVPPSHLPSELVKVNQLKLSPGKQPVCRKSDMGAGQEGVMLSATVFRLGHPGGGGGKADAGTIARCSPAAMAAEFHGSSMNEW